jgi:predicted O-methyltransferase YrrM
MEKDLAIILVESDITHTSLFIRNLKQAGVDNEILQFRNGHESLDFLF